jgi:uncharacterized protein (DUF4415 family)
MQIIWDANFRHAKQSHMKGKNMKAGPNLKSEYDFSKGSRGAVIPNTGKTRITTYLDNDVIDWLKIRGESERKGYQTVLNELLRKQIEPEKPIAEVIRQVIREELKLAA